MNPFFKSIVDAFTISEDLENFAILWSIDEDPYVKERIFNLKCKELFDLIDQNVMIPTPELDNDHQEKINENISNPILNSNDCLNNDKYNFSDRFQPTTSPNPITATPTFFRPWINDSNDMQRTPLHVCDHMHSRPKSPQQGPSQPKKSVQEGYGLPQDKPYTYRMKNQRVFAKNKAVDTTYQVKFNEMWQGRKLKELNNELHNMVDDVLDNIRREPRDLGRVVIQHDRLNHPIVIPLQQWETLDSETVMDGISKVLNSNEELVVDESMNVTIGSIEVPKGSGGGCLPITTLFGHNNSLKRKRSIIEITDKELCLPIAVGMCYLRACKHVPKEEWVKLTENEKESTLIEKSIKHKTCLKSYYNNLLKKTKTSPRKDMAEILCNLASVPKNRPHDLNDITSFENLLDVNINVISSKLGNKFIRVTNNEDRTNLFVLLVEYKDVQHYHPITSMSAFFSKSYFCEVCLKGYSNREKHSCETRCEVCVSHDCTEKDLQSCLNCKRQCRSTECYIRHKENKQCDKMYQCTVCKKVNKKDDRDPQHHICGEWKCKSCNKYHVGEHLCYQRATTKENIDKKFIFYDFETRQDDKMECDEGYKVKLDRSSCCAQDQIPCAKCRLCQNCRESWCGLNQHIVNFAVLQSSCSHCRDQELTPQSKCENCGNRCILCSRTDRKSKYTRPPCNNTCGFRERTFEGDDTANQFCSHITQDFCKDSILIAHNSKAFDIYPILEVLIDRHGIRPNKIIYNGTKVMYMHIALKLNLTFVDSYNFLPMKLADLPKAFGLGEMCKGYFPHYFNRKENQKYCGTYPATSYYGCDFMSSKDKDAFINWYETMKDGNFDFRTEMLTYCRNDVDLLRRSVLHFRKLMMETTNGIDPFDYVTIASACMGIYKTLFLQEDYELELRSIYKDETKWVPVTRCDEEDMVFLDEDWVCVSSLDKQYKSGSKRFVKSAIAMVPTEGYAKKDNFSKSSIAWLEWVMSDKKVHIQHALNGGEFKIPGTNYRVDGFDEINNIFYEFNGCVFHGCPICFPNERTGTTHPTTNQSMEELYVNTMKRQKHIESLGYRCISIWEHQFHQQLETNVVMKQYVDQLDIQERLNPRNSFFGGRTNAIRLHYKISEENETIEYYDFTSLYPWTNKYCRYPLGHPIIITDEFEHMSNYFGIAKIKIIPPRGLFHPVLPYTSNGKLKFPLCRTCADIEHKNPCNCSDDERAIIGTWCTPEILKALEKGYTILKIYEVYHFPESTQYDPNTKNGGLFANYANTFLKIKQEASGWPNGCNTDQQKMDYIRQYEDKEGIKLDFDKIEVNPGLRSFAKLCLNSFWGKFGQRLTLKQSGFIHETEADEFFRMLTDPRKTIQNFHILSPEILQLEWSDDPLFLPIDKKTNIFLASFTTMWARLRLYSVLEEVGKDCLYMDTDSVIFVDRNNEHVKSLPVGNYLGQLTNEIPTEYIEEYVSGGPKNYAYRTVSGKETCKVRGFTLNWANAQLINFNSVKELVVNTKQESITVINPVKITRHARKRKLYNRPEQKEYKMVYTKRVLMPDLSTVPYGY